MIRLLSVLPLLSAAVACTTSHPTSVLNVAARLIEAKPGRLGHLTLLRALELRSDHPGFGGLSGILIEDGKQKRMMAVSDRGNWLEAHLVHDANGVLKGTSGWRIQPLHDPRGRPVNANKANKLFDAEALARGRDGSLLVGFEQVHRVWRYAPDLGASAKLVALPRGVTGAPGNGGLEGITVLVDGRLLLISERYENRDGSLKGWLGREGRFDPVSYVPTDDFSPTDLATLSDGDVLVLERSYSLARGVRARVRRIPAATLRPGARLEPVEIARLAPPVPVDNFEGIAVHEDAGGRGTFVYLISDDNFNPLQKTLLLQLRLDD